jgi:transposase
VHAIGIFLLRKPMRGKDDRSEILFSCIRLDERIPADHPLRVIRQLVDAALAELSRAFAKLYARDGRPSIPPERLLRGLLLQAFYTMRSELQLMEQLNYNLLFRWFVGRPTNQCGMRPCFARTGIGCSTAILPVSS